MKRSGFSLVAGILVCVALTAPATTRYVDLNNPAPVAPYTNWLSAAIIIQDAIDVAVAGDEIVVTNGVYLTGARAVYGVSNRVAVTKAVAVRSVNGPGPTSIVGSGPYGPEAVRCVYMADGAVLAGFTVANGATQDSGNWVSNRTGGGIFCDSTNAFISNCVLTGNSAWYDAGGVYGGTLNNCILTGNSAQFGSGGGASYSALNNCTLTGNSAYWGGGDVMCLRRNCIVYYNTAVWDPDSSGGTYNYCCTPGLLFEGEGNFTAEPLLVDTNGWSNLRLQAGSPCINAGANAYAPGVTDLDGYPRIAGARVDVGAYEFQGTGLSGFTAWLWQYGLRIDGSADYVDSDGDGHNNWQEWIAGTNPTNAASALRMLSASGAVSGVTVTWSSVASRSYALERVTDLGGVPAFSVLQSNIVGWPEKTSWTDTNGVGGAARFYRVRVEQ